MPARRTERRVLSIVRETGVIIFTPFQLVIFTGWSGENNCLVDYRHTNVYVRLQNFLHLRARTNENCETRELQSLLEIDRIIWGSEISSKVNYALCDTNSYSQIVERYSKYRRILSEKKSPLLILFQGYWLLEFEGNERALSHPSPDYVLYIYIFLVGVIQLKSDVISIVLYQNWFFFLEKRGSCPHK